MKEGAEMDNENKNEFIPENDKPLNETEIDLESTKTAAFVNKEENSEAAEVLSEKENNVSEAEENKTVAEPQPQVNPAGGIRTTYVPGVSNNPAPQRPTYSYTPGVNPGVNGNNATPYRRPVYNPNPNAPRTPYTVPGAPQNPYQQRPVVPMPEEKKPEKKDIFCTEITPTILLMH